MTDINPTVETAKDEESWGEWFNRTYNGVASRLEVAWDATFGGASAEKCVSANYEARMGASKARSEREAALKAENDRHLAETMRIKGSGSHVVKEGVTVEPASA